MAVNLKEIEDTYNSIISGYDEPDLMGCNGQTLLDLAAKLGDTHPIDKDGNDINPSLGYWITKQGIFRMEE